MNRFLCAAIAGVFTSLASAHAQTVPDMHQPDLFPSIDASGVNLISGVPSAQSPIVSIGGAGGLAYGVSLVAGDFTDSAHGFIFSGPGIVGVNVGGAVEHFTAQPCTPTPCTPTVYRPVRPNGGEMTRSGNIYTYVTGNGTEIVFDASMKNMLELDSTFAVAVITRITAPNGDETTFHYTSTVVNEYDIFPEPPVWESSQTVYRLQSIRNNRGYQLYFHYGGELTTHHLDNEGTDDIDWGLWPILESVSAINMGYERCADNAMACTLTDNWPTLNITDFGFGGDITFELFGDNIGLSGNEISLQTIFRRTNYRLTGIQGPGATMNEVEYEYCSSTDVTNGDCASTNQLRRVRLTGETSTQTDDLVTTYTYAAPSAGYTPVDVANAVRQITAPGNITTVVEFNGYGQVVRYQNSAGAITTYEYDSDNRVTLIEAPHTSSTGNPYDNSTQYFYDARGNLTEIRVAEGVEVCGSTCEWVPLGTKTWEASYPEVGNDVCLAPVTCNLPSSSTVPGRGTTNYTWNATHGGLESTTLPAPTTGAVRPVIEYNYRAYQARFKNTSGTLAFTGDDITLPYLVESCAIGALSTCSAANTRLQYAEAGLRPGQSLPSGYVNNLETSVQRVYDGQTATSVTLQTDYTFNRYGLVATIDGPQTGTVDRTYLYYDTLGRPIATVGIDPDGVGGLLHRASETIYDARGRISEVIGGTATTQPSNDLGETPTVARLSTSVTVYDGFHRPEASYAYLTNGGSHTYTAFTETSYHAASGLPFCSAIRMGTPGTAYSSGGPTLSDACTPGTSPLDLVTETIYDSHGRVSQVTTGHGHGSSTEETVTYTYHANGLVSTVRDSELNYMAYLYDVRNRLLSVVLPDPSDGDLSPTTATVSDIRTYNDLGELTAYQDYAGDVISYVYDNLGRMTFMNVADQGVTTDTYDLTLTYNNYGQVLQSTNGAWYALVNTYDALGRQLTQNTGISTLTQTYDEAGRRASMDWSYPRTGNLAAMTIEYDYLYTGEVEEIREATPGHTPSVLINYTYDNYGRMTGATRPGAVPDTAYIYNNRGLLQTLRHGPSGSPVVQFDYTYDGAGRIASRYTSPAAFGYSGNTTGTIDRCYDGRNRYEGVPTTDCDTLAANPPRYDDNGNLIEDTDGRDWLYDDLNRVRQARNPGGTHGANGTWAGTYTHDPEGRLYSNKDEIEPYRLYEHDGANLVATYSSWFDMEERYVHGPGIDNPIVRYNDHTHSDPHWMLADERGSVVAYYDDTGARQGGINTYDEYGEQGANNHGLFRYAGRPWLRGADVYDNRNRAYHPGLGRFLQTDPIGQAGGLNIYNYTSADPINHTDPLGLYSNGCFHHDRYVCARSGYLEPEQYWPSEQMGGFRPNAMTMLLYGSLAHFGWGNVATTLEELGLEGSRAFMTLVNNACGGISSYVVAWLNDENLEAAGSFDLSRGSSFSYNVTTIWTAFGDRQHEFGSVNVLLGEGADRHRLNQGSPFPWNEDYYIDSRNGSLIMQAMVLLFRPVPMQECVPLNRLL